MSVTLDTQELAQKLQETAIVDAATKETQTPASKDPSPIDELHRVYVGNLSYTTTEGELKDLFAQAGEIASIAIPARRNFRNKSTRPAGIAFIGYKTDEEAHKAIESLHGKELGERTISVKLARPLSERKPRQPRAPKTEKSDETDKSAAESEDKADVNLPGQAEGLDEGKTAEGATSTPAKKKKPRKTKTKKIPAATTEGESEESTQSDAKKENGTTTPTEGATPKDGSKEDKSQTPSRSPRNARQIRQKRASSRLNAGIPSEKTLFVYGLTPEMTSEQLKDLFKEHEPTGAQIALRDVPTWLIKKMAEQGQQRLGRGFGFVSFADKQHQQSALEAMNGYKHNDRELAVKVAMDAPPRASKTAVAAESATAENVGEKVEAATTAQAESKTEIKEETKKEEKEDDTDDVKTVKETVQTKAAETETSSAAETPDTKQDD